MRMQRPLGWTSICKLLKKLRPFSVVNGTKSHPFQVCLGPQFRSSRSLEEPTITHLALRLLILTGLRSNPIRFARLDEIDRDVWTVPADNMKARLGKAKNFRVPLSEEARHVIQLALPYERDGYLFPSARRGVSSDATMARHMERKGLSARPHGFRSSLRTWLADKTNAPHEVAEAVLAHITDSKVVRTYRQTNYLDQRRVLLEHWTRYSLQRDADVIDIGARK